MDNDIEKIRSWIRAIGVSLVVGSLCMIILTLLEFSKYHTGTIADWPYLGLCLFFCSNNHWRHHSTKTNSLIGYAIANGDCSSIGTIPKQRRFE